jgi:uncharacterized NAD-dependent epimerase/dehydratase family protein
MSRLVVLTEGQTNLHEAKTAVGLLRYRGGDVVALLDSTCAGRTTQEVLGVGGETPFVSDLASISADTLVIGIAPPGGQLPQEWRSLLRGAIENGMDIVSGLHALLGEDPEFAALAKKHGTQVHDLRRAPENVTVSLDLARAAPCHRVHTVGNDVSVGKMVTALELTRELGNRGHQAGFVATGQTGILIAGEGVAVDHVISDFIAGATEAEVVRKQDQEFVVIEGQGSLANPRYSGVTLGLLHGCAPQTLIMVYAPTRQEASGTGVTLPPLKELIRIYEEMASLLTPCKVVGVAFNPDGLASAEAHRRRIETEAELGLPVTDVIEEGPERLVTAILERHQELRGEGRLPPAKDGPQDDSA